MLIRLIVLYGLCISTAYAYGQFGPAPQGSRINPNETLLSSKSANEQAAIVNLHSGNPGCYILCLGPQDAGLYSIGRTYNLHGLIRISGQYPGNTVTQQRSKRYCYPNGLQGNPSAPAYYKKLCDDTFSSCNELCTGNGDTGGFFGNPVIK